MTPLIIRADAGGQIGTGHLMRCLALAQSWKSSGGAVVFITNCESDALRERLKSEGFAAVEIEKSYPHPSDLPQTQAVLKNYAGSWCVVDGYHFDAEFCGKIRGNDSRVLIIDDTAHQSFYDADAILNQNINADALHYNCPKDTILLLGTRFALLRNEFAARQNRKRNTPAVARRILITMGGGDFHNQTLKVIRSIEHLEIENLEVKAVVGASNPHFADLQKAVVASSVHIELICGAENMAELMAWADAAVIVAGGTLWEMLFMRVPLVSFAITDFQAGILETLRLRGAIEYAGKTLLSDDTEFRRILIDILESKEKRERMSYTSGQIVDGGGCRRAAAFLKSGTAENV